MTVCKITCYTVTGKVVFEQDHVAFNKDVKDYIDKWPNHCTDCDGWGGKTSCYDPSPSGISLSPGYFTEYDPCEKCLDKDICPRCGSDDSVVLLEGTDTESGLSTDHCKCWDCEWVEHKTEGLPQDPPEPPECDCWNFEDVVAEHYDNLEGWEQ